MWSGLAKSKLGTNRSGRALARRQLQPRLRGFDDDHQLAAFAAEWQDFLRSIDEDTDPTVTGDYGRHLVAILTAVEESDRLGKEVEIPETLGVVTSS